jgi:benzoate membrane transport protein
MSESIGAFLICAARMTLAGATGWFARVMDRIPQALAAAQLAGVLVLAVQRGRA